MRRMRMPPEMWILGGYAVLVTIANVFLWRRMFDAECTVEYKDDWIRELNREIWHLKSVIKILEKK
jgi:hypothetical protein